MPTIRVKANDTRPFDGVLMANGSPVDLTGVLGIQFLMRPAGGGALKGGAAVVLDARAARVRYVWQTVDLQTPGVFRAEFQVTFGDGTVETYPNGEYIDIVVMADLS